MAGRTTGRTVVDHVDLDYDAMKRRRNSAASGFTLVEVMVASLLIAVGIAGMFAGIRTITRSEAQAKDAELLQSLAQEKINDMQLQADPSDVGGQGDFADRGYPDVTWTTSIVSTSVTNVDQVTVEARRGSQSQALTTELYVVPVQSTTSTTSSTTGTGAGQ